MKKNALLSITRHNIKAKNCEAGRARAGRKDTLSM